jgi:hypothetical protein
VLSLLPKHVQVSYCTQQAAGSSQPFEEGRHLFHIEVVAENLEGSPHAPRGNPHVV